MKERDIQRFLFADMRTTHGLVVPNYTPKGWHECDVWAVTKSGYMTEHEIKLTLSDFRADQKKAGRAGGSWSAPKELKFERLANRDPRGPKRFWYVVPDGLLDPEDVPEWAGLKIVKPWTDLRYGHIHIRKQAPELHSNKCDRTICEHALGVMYYRFWAEVQRSHEQRMKPVETTDDRE